MNARANIETWMTKVEGIRYENPNGGAYAYVQYLAYTRELGKLLRPVKSLERHMEKIEATCWLFNEYLAASFTQRQKAIFEDQMSVTRETFDTMRMTLKGLDLNLIVAGENEHLQAA